MGERPRREKWVLCNSEQETERVLRGRAKIFESVFPRSSRLAISNKGAKEIGCSGTETGRGKQGKVSGDIQEMAIGDEEKTNHADKQGIESDGNQIGDKEMDRDDRRETETGDSQGMESDGDNQTEIGGTWEGICGKLEKESAGEQGTGGGDRQAKKPGVAGRSSAAWPRGAATSVVAAAPSCPRERSGGGRPAAATAGRRRRRRSGTAGLRVAAAARTGSGRPGSPRPRSEAFPGQSCKTRSVTDCAGGDRDRDSGK